MSRTDRGGIDALASFPLGSMGSDLQRVQKNGNSSIVRDSKRQELQTVVKVSVLIR